MTQLVGNSLPASVRSASLSRRLALRVLALCLLVLPGTLRAAAKPEDILKGQLIISDSSFPLKWTSAAEYASRLKKLHKSSLFYDKKTGKLTIYYAAFFAQPVNDVQVNFVIYDITNGANAKAKKGAWEAFLGRKGERALFNSVELDKEDIEMNKKYLFAIESGRQIIAKGEITLRGELPKYSGKVEFSEEDTKKKE
ncbi:MAG TPA: hypothetical protein PKL17_16005 [Pseudomonadota bacterium]|jgi:hypothetical protein|nr:hypothetical protein [Pseudomonadota bacterium]HNI59360.1 hypothetical protein [Pseudomonadota bacterium]HNK46289.1 hypothetical protein [Pseudomonadota bacterium]HNN52948.1 hypothetical protein [Pseudomonadota bacterium]